MRSRHCRRRLLWCLHVMSLSRAGSYYSITHLWGPCALDALAGTGAVDLPSTSVVNLKSKGPRGIHTSHSRHTTCTQSTLADEPRLGQRQAHGESQVKSSQDSKWRSPIRLLWCLIAGASDREGRSLRNRHHWIAPSRDIIPIVLFLIIAAPQGFNFVPFSGNLLYSNAKPIQADVGSDRGPA